MQTLQLTNTLIEEVVMPSILLVEDDLDLASMIADYLLKNGYLPTIEIHGDRAVDRILRDNPDAVILDIGLPGKSGFTICQQVRQDYRGIILLLTARGDEADEVRGFECGADDYIAKPVRPRALLARLKLHLKRSTPSDTPSGIYVAGPLTVDESTRSVTLYDKPIDLTSAEFDLLLVLAKNAGQPISRSEIYQLIHEMRYDGLDRSIDLRISRLRRKLGDDPLRPKRIKSVRGTGYQLSTEL